MPDDDQQHPRRLRVATWNMDHWKRNEETRCKAWSTLKSLGLDVSLLQEAVPRDELSHAQLVYRPIGGTRHWGNAVVAFNSIMLREVQTVTTTYSSRAFPMLGTIPGALIVAKQAIEHIGEVTFVSVYGVIDTYAQTTMLRLVADLIPLFDSAAGDHVILGGDFNVTPVGDRSSKEWRRYEAILRAVESLGLVDLATVVRTPSGPPPTGSCACGMSPCNHVLTYRGKTDGPPVSQLDYLYATSSLAAQCQRLYLADVETRGLSDHVPLIAEFEFGRPLNRTTWGIGEFLTLLGQRHGFEIRAIAERLVDWARQKDAEFVSAATRARMDRLPLSSGSDPELWFQVDLQAPEGLQYTFSVRADGNLAVQFQYLKSPFETEDSRSQLLEELNTIPGVAIQAKVRGRPTVPLSVFRDRERLEQFLAVWTRVVDRSVRERKF